MRQTWGAKPSLVQLCVQGRLRARNMIAKSWVLGRVFVILESQMSYEIAFGYMVSQEVSLFRGLRFIEFRIPENTKSIKLYYNKLAHDTALANQSN